MIQNSADFTVEMNAKSRNTVCNLGILANAFEMAASETTNAFLFVDQAQSLDTGFAENLVEDHFGYFKKIPLREI